MLGRLLTNAIGLVTAAQLLAAPSAQAADYRGMTSGWPNYANGYYAANYPANYAAGPTYYVARPVSAAGYAAPPSGTMYMPVRAAYANPTYFAAYGKSPVAYQPVSAGYAPTAAGYAPTTAYYAPVTANYAPANSYAVTPAGLSSAGSEAAAYYGQPTPLNYVPPRYAYRTTYAAVPVYTYRPVTAYDPIVGQPVTCMQASTCNTCQPQRSRCSSWWNPFTWFSHSSGCCAKPAPTTAYCGTGCGQPYYPVQPVVPVVPAPGSTIPSNVIPAVPSTVIPPAGTRIPPPPTVAPGTRGIITTPGTITTPGVITTPGLSPADLQPRIAPGSITPLPGGAIPAQPGTPLNPGFGIPAAPGPGSFQTTPIQPGPPGSFGTGTNYAPTTDPNSSTLTPAAQPGAAPSDMTPSKGLQTGPSHSVFGSGYRGSSPARTEASRPTDGVIRAPDVGPALPPSVQTVPDLDAPRSPQPNNVAPQLLDPRDKTARRDPRWAVVPAQWPQKEARPLGERGFVATKSHEPRKMTASPYVKAQADAVVYDDGGWKSAAH